jgi:hypothetical protein
MVDLPLDAAGLLLPTPKPQLASAAERVVAPATSKKVRRDTFFVTCITLPPGNFICQPFLTDAGMV